jgi:ABC-2 type transport system permease protein
MKLALAFMALLKKEVILRYRYFVNSIGTLITLYLVFMLMFLGAQGIAGGVSLGDGLDNMVVGYITWFVLLLTYQAIPYTILGEAEQGTLEQLYMAPLGFGAVAAFKLIAEILVDMVLVVLLLLVIIATTGTNLHLDIPSLLPLLLLVIAGGSGLGFILGGITLLLKRIHSYLQIVQFAIIILVAAPPIAPWRWLPVILPAHWMRQVLVQGQGLSQIPLQDWLAMAGAALASIAVGVTVFKLCELQARKQGIIGHF